jgi:hypothetical protein
MDDVIADERRWDSLASDRRVCSLHEIIFSDHTGDGARLCHIIQEASKCRIRHAGRDEPAFLEADDAAWPNIAWDERAEPAPIERHCSQGRCG